MSLLSVSIRVFSLDFSSEDEVFTLIVAIPRLMEDLNLSNASAAMASPYDVNDRYNADNIIGYLFALAVIV